MKTTILLTLGLMIFILGFSQKNNDFALVPQGSFSVQGTGTLKTITFESFWMSNEITNREFREFYNQVKNSPNDSISWIDISSYKNDGKSKVKVISIAYSDLIDKLMDESAWKSVFSQGDYFTNPKYDNYPVVGVTWEGANYYCNWRTKEESKRIKGQGLIMDYRLPSQYEWEYALTYNDSKSIVGTKELHQIDKGDKNKLGILNLNGNVAEWTSSSAPNGSVDCKVVTGSSWKSVSKETQKQFVMRDKASDCIGFRVVKSDLKR